MSYIYEITRIWLRIVRNRIFIKNSHLKFCPHIVNMVANYYTNHLNKPSIVILHQNCHNPIQVICRKCVIENNQSKNIQNNTSNPKKQIHNTKRICKSQHFEISDNDHTSKHLSPEIPVPKYLPIFLRSLTNNRTDDIL